MRELVRELRQASHALRRRPGFTLLAALTLALGIGANTAIFGVVYTVLLRPLPFHAPDRLMQLWETIPGLDRRGASPADFLDWRAQGDDFASLSAYDARAGNLLGIGTPQRVRYVTASGNFFRTLGTPIARGRPFRESDDDAPEAVLSDGLWRERYGADPGVIGRALRLDDRTYTIVGVAPAGFDFPAGTELYVRARQDIPELNIPGDIRQLRDAWYFRVVGRLRPGVPLTAAQAHMSAVARRLAALYPASNRDADIRLVSLHDELVGDARPKLLLLLGAVGLVLLVACANVANLVLIRALDRRKELAVRAALGAGSRRLARHLLAEAVLLALLGCALGLVVAVAGTRALDALGTSTGLPLDRAHLAAPVLAFGIGLSLLTVLLFGSIPALVGARVGLREMLGERAAASPAPAGRRSRDALVVAEVALALVLAAGAGLMLRTLGRLEAVPPGFRPDGLLTVRFSLPRTTAGDGADATRFYRDVAERVASLPGVTAAAVALGGPLETGPTAGLRIEGRPNLPGELPNVAWQPVTADYFRAAGIPLRRGRLFDGRDRDGSAPVALVNETLARLLWPGQDPVGQRVNTGLDGAGVWVTIVGVVGDTRNESLASAPAPQIYRPLAQPARFRGEEMMLLARGGGSHPELLLPAVRRAIADVQADVPVYGARTGEDLVGGEAAESRAIVALLGGFAALALLLGAVGIYGVTAYAVRQREREIGVRLALGAGRASVLALVLRSGMAPVLGGLGLGVLGALAGTRLLQRLLFGVSPTDPLTFAAVPMLLAAVAALAMAIPAARAARMDPLDAIRSE